MKTEKSWDFLKLLEKNEIIAYLKENRFLQAPFRQSVVSFKYQHRLLPMLEEHKALLESDFVKNISRIHAVEKKMEELQKWYEKNSEI